MLIPGTYIFFCFSVCFFFIFYFFFLYVLLIYRVGVPVIRIELRDTPCRRARLFKGRAHRYWRSFMPVHEMAENFSTSTDWEKDEKRVWYGRPCVSSLLARPTKDKFIGELENEWRLKRARRMKQERQLDPVIGIDQFRREAVQFSRKAPIFYVPSGRTTIAIGRGGEGEGGKKIVSALEGAAGARSHYHGEFAYRCAYE